MDSDESIDQYMFIRCANCICVIPRCTHSGKGKLVDVLSQDADLICRCAGGNNAGHTVKVDDVTYDFHLLPRYHITSHHITSHHILAVASSTPRRRASSVSVCMCRVR